MKKQPPIFTISHIATISPLLHNKAQHLLVEKKTWKNYFPLHRHEYLELEFILKGQGVEVFNGHEYNLEPGMFYLLRPSDFHEIYLQEDLEVITISFDLSLLEPSFSNQFFSIDKNFICYTKDDDFNYIATLFEQFNKEYQRSDFLKSLHLQNLLSCILIVLLRLTSSAPTDTFYSDDILPALNYLNLHFAENPSLQDIADIVHLNPSYLSSKFKKHTNKSYSDYLTDLKITYAKKLLAANSFNISDIAFKSGFNSINSFSRAFKLRTDMSPSAYREFVKQQKDEH